MLGNGQTEKAYWTHEIAEELKVSDSTIRKWCILLEKNGYEFTKGANESRAFTERDLSALRKFQALLRENKLTKESASILIAEQFKVGERNEGTPPMQVEKPNTQTHALAEMVQGLKERLEAYELFMQKQEEHTRSLIEENKSLKAELQSIKERAASTDEKIDTFIAETRAERHQKKGFFSKLFGK